MFQQHSLWIKHNFFRKTTQYQTKILWKSNLQK